MMLLHISRGVVEAKKTRKKETARFAEGGFTRRPPGVRVARIG